MGPVRLMILGGGSSQINAFHRARELGFYTILADRDPSAPARAIADEFVQASTFDIEAVSRGAVQSGATAIVAIGTDQPVYTAAVASAEVGLPFPLAVEQAGAVTNKRIMKRLFTEYRIPSAPWTLLAPPVEDWEVGRLRPPYVVKPVDSQGQRGIVLVPDREGVIAHYPIARRFSREEAVLVEEYVPSKEITVSGWVDRGGNVDIWTITDRITLHNPPGLGVCIAHRFPSCYAGTFDPQIRRLTEEIASVFQLTNGPLYFQMLVSDRGVVVNEIAFRLGGAYEDQSLPPVTGVDILALQLRSASGEEPVPRNRVSLQPTATHFAVPLIFAHPGVVTRLIGDDTLRRVPGVTDCRFLLPVGTEIVPMENSTQRIAYAVLHGNSRKEINSLIDLTFDTLKVIDHTGRNILLDTRDSLRFV